MIRGEMKCSGVLEMNTEINVDAIVDMHCASQYIADTGSPSSIPLPSNWPSCLWQ